MEEQASIKERAERDGAVLQAEIMVWEKSSKATQINACGSCLRHKLVELGWTYQRKLPPWLVRVHPCKRAYIMVNPIRCWQLLGLILSRGWSEHETKLALAVEVPPTPEGDKWKKDNGDLISKSMGLLPKCKIDDIRVISIVCSHTNQALRLPSGNLPPPQGFEYMATSTGTMHHCRVHHWTQ